jgi:hypothetical protein
LAGWLGKKMEGMAVKKTQDNVRAYSKFIPCLPKKVLNKLSLKILKNI